MTPLAAPACDALGWVAAALTLATFASGQMLRLRVLALCANAAFIAYGWQAGLVPVLALHLGLLPVNAWRLGLLLRARRAPHAAAPPALCNASATPPAQSACLGFITTTGEHS